MNDYPKLYLDNKLSREDIEELGGSYDPNPEPIPCRKEGYDPTMAFYFDDDAQDSRKLKQWVLFLHEDNEVWIELIIGTCGEGWVFKGKLEYKHELRNVLKYIGV